MKQNTPKINMLKLKSIIIPVFLLFFAQILLSQPTEIRLRDAIQNAYKNTPGIVKNDYSIQVQELNIRGSYGSLFPDLKLSAGWARTNQVTQEGFQIIGGINQLIPASNLTTNNLYVNLRSDVTLFNGMANYDNLDLQKQTKTSLEIQNTKLKQDVTIKVLTDYITVLKNDQVVIINQATLEDSRAQLDKIKIFVEVGKKTLADVYKQDVVVAQNELAVEQAKNNLDKSIADLAFDAQYPVDKSYSVNKNEFVTSVSYDGLEEYVNRHSNIDALVSTAVKNRTDLKYSEYYLNIQQTNIDISRSLLLFPTISGFGSYQISGEKINNIYDARVFTVGLTLSYPIFQGFNLDNKKQQSVINYKSAEEDVRLLKTQIELDIKKAVLDLKSLLKQIEITDRNLKSAEQDKLLAEESYRIGLGTLLEVNTANINLNNIQIQKSNLIYNFILSQKTLEYYQGLLKY
jgi:outer membrane protein